MGITERLEEGQIEASLGYVDSSTQKLARIALINTEMSNVQDQLRDLTKQHTDLQGERYQLECDLARAD